MILAMVLLIAGARIDRGDFHTVRPLGDVPRGMTSLVLDADAVANSHDLADIRIVDRSDRQIPYVYDPRPSPLYVAVPVPAPAREGSSSIYHFTLPYRGKLELATSARVFSRNVTLQRQRVPWRNDDPDKPAAPIAFQAKTNDVDVVIDDGDNAPLPISSARLVLPNCAIRFNAPGGPLTLMYGAAIPAPQYDIGLMATRILAEPAREIHPPPFTPKNETHTERRLFWVAIAIAVVALLAILGRLLAVRT